MERSKYFNYTRPTATQLNYTEDSRARSVLRRTDSACQPGIVSGFIVTVNGGTPTLVDIGVGTGYTGGKYPSLDVSGDDSGERISTIISGTTDTTGIALADYTLGVKNYISLVYAETESNPLTEIFYPFNSYDTEVAEGFTVSVMTETNWNLLSVAQKRERILIAIVTAKGVGVALTSADIQQVVQPLNHPTPSGLTNITGVTFTGIAQTTPLGSGTLRYATATAQLFWTAPGDSEGVGVVVSSSGVFTLYSNDTAYWVRVSVVYAGLPAVNASDTVTINSLYGKTIPRFSAKDTLHRDMIGNGTPTLTNPHGLTLTDIEGGTLEHADLYHKNGISYEADNSASGQLSCSISGGHDIEIINFGGYTNSFLVDGNSYETLTGYAAGVVGVVTFDVTPALTSADYLIYVDSAGAPQRVRLASYNTGGNPVNYQVLWSANIEILDIHNITAGSCTLAWDDATATLTYESQGSTGVGAPVKVMNNNFDPAGAPYGIYKVYADNGDYIIVSVTGDLGGANSTTFLTNKNETTYADETILKLAIVTFNATSITLSNVRDIRQFLTSDIRDTFYEEHDEDGRHTKIIPRQFRVNASTAALMVEADNTAICVRAQTDIGITVDVSGSTGIHAVCSNGDYGIFGGAQNTGLYGVVAFDYGAYGNAARSYGVYGKASVTGLFGTATSFGAAGVAKANTGVYGLASSSIGVFGSAKVDTGVYGLADQDYGVRASASRSYGAYGQASQFGGYFYASSSANAVTITGLVGSASNGGAAGGASNSAIGVYGVVAAGAAGTGVAGFGATGVHGSGATGIIGQGTLGGSFSGSTKGASVFCAAGTGLGALVSSGTGINVSASTGAGVYALANPAGEFGGMFVNTGSTTAAVYGARGLCYNASSHASATAYGVYGSAGVSGTLGTAIGVYGYGLSYGALFSGSVANPGDTTAPAGGGVAISAQGNYFLKWDGRLVTPGPALGNIAIPVIIRSGAVTETHAIVLAAFSTTSWQTWGGP